MYSEAACPGCWLTVRSCQSAVRVFTEYRMVANSSSTWLPSLLSLCLLSSLAGVEISYRDICGNKLHDSCPDSVNTKIIGGSSTCSEKVPWNVLVENVGERRAPGKVCKTEVMVWLPSIGG